MYWLKRHPFEVEAHFGHCLVLTYAFPERILQPLLPPGLVLDALEGNGFLAVAVVETLGLRPVVLPRWFGEDFVLAGYRIFVKHRTDRRGLRILESGANSRRMVLLGNLLTHYRYRKVEALLAEDGPRLKIVVQSGDGTADLTAWADLQGPENLPARSPFRDQREARRFAGPMPYTFTYEEETGSLLRIRGVRRNWKPRLVAVEVQRNTFLQRSPFNQAEPVLACAFHVQDIPYRWERAVREPLRRAS